jgi:hypothetical protein
MAMDDKSNWEKSSDRLVALFDQLAPQEPEVAINEDVRMASCFVNGTLFTGLHKQSMIFRLSDTDQAAFLELDGTALFEPMPGRKMKSYVVMADPLDRKRTVLTQWMQRSLAFTRSLPPKAKKVASPKKTKKANR